MAGRLKGKVALITGAARGQGAAEAMLFAQEGASLVLGDVRDDDLHLLGIALRRSGGGSIVIISSIYGLIAAVRRLPTRARRERCAS